MEEQVQGLMNENSELNRALLETREMYEQAISEKESIVNLYEDFKKQYSFKETECEEALK